MYPHSEAEPMTATTRTNQDCPPKMPGEEIEMSPRKTQHRKRASSQHNNNKRRPRKSVSFDEASNQSYPSVYEFKEDTAETWYSIEDFRRIKKSNTNFLQSLLKEGRTVAVWQHTLDRAYNAVCEETHESLEDLDHQWESSLLSGIEHFHLQSTYGNHHHTVLGMEHLISGDIAAERNYRRNAQVNCVYAIEETHQFPNADVQAHYIRIACERISLPARLYSRETAMALAASLGQSLAPPKRPPQRQAAGTTTPDLEPLDESSCSSTDESFETAKEIEVEY